MPTQEVVYAPSIEAAIDRLEAITGKSLDEVTGIFGAAIEAVGCPDQDAPVWPFRLTIPDHFDADVVVSAFAEFTPQ